MAAAYRSIWRSLARVGYGTGGEGSVDEAVGSVCERRSRSGFVRCVSRDLKYLEAKDHVEAQRGHWRREWDIRGDCGLYGDNSNVTFLLSRRIQDGLEAARSQKRHAQFVDRVRASSHAHRR